MPFQSDWTETTTRLPSLTARICPVLTKCPLFKKKFQKSDSTRIGLTGQCRKFLLKNFLFCASIGMVAISNRFLQVTAMTLNPGRKKYRRTNRTLLIEELESRELLSATPWALLEDAMEAGSETTWSDRIDPTSDPVASVITYASGFHSDPSPVLAPLAAPPATSPDNRAETNGTDWDKIEAAKINNKLLDSHVTWTWDDASNIYRVTKIVAQSQSLDGEMDLSGLTALTELTCNNNQLTELNVSGLTSLTALNCSHNQLKSLDASGCIALTSTSLNFRSNEMTTLNVSGCIALESLFLQNSSGNGINGYNNNLTSVNASGCIALESLRSDNSQLIELDVSDCTALTYLRCDNSPLTTLNMSGCTSLKDTDVQWMNTISKTLTSLDISRTTLTELNYTGNLTELKVSDCTSLTVLNCSNNKLTTLDVSTCTALTSLNCSGNQLNGIDVSACTVLEILNCSSNLLTKLDVSGLIALASLNCSNNKLTTLNVSGCLLLTATSPPIDATLIFSNNPLLESLDVSGCTSLKELRCAGGAGDSSFSKLSELNVTGCTALETLTILETQLTTLDVSDCIALKTLYFNSNKLTVLDVSKNTALETLEFHFEYELSSLTGVSGLTALTRLSCDSKKLTSLDVSGCTALTSLMCDGEKLTSLDVSGCIALTELVDTTSPLTSFNASGCTALKRLWLWGSGSQLTMLDVSGCTALESLSIDASKLTTLDLSDCVVLQEVSCAGLRFSTIETLLLPDHIDCIFGTYFPNYYSVDVDETIEFLASEYLGETTKFKWYVDRGDSTPVEIPSICYTNENGIFTFNGQMSRFAQGEYSVHIYCVMTNDKFPDVKLGTETISLDVGWNNSVIVNSPDENNRIIVTDASLVNTKAMTIKGLAQNKSTATSVTLQYKPGLSEAEKFYKNVSAILVELYAPNNVNPIAAFTFGWDGKLIPAGTALNSLSISDSEILYITYKGKKYESGFKVTVNGLDASTKYTLKVQAQTSEYPDKFSKVTEKKITTKKYAAPKGNKVEGKGLGTATISLKSASNIAKVTDAVIKTGTKSYEVGILVNKIWLFGDSADAYFVKEGITVAYNGTCAGKAVISGLASQKYTFGIREVAALDTAVAHSDVAKFNVSPAPYKAAVIKQDGTAKLLKGNASGTYFKNKLDTLDTSKYVRGYEYVWYNDTKDTPGYKTYMDMPAGASFNVGTLSSDGVFTGGTFDKIPPSKLGTTKATIGVWEVLYEVGNPTNVIAKSALTKVNVKW